MPNRPITNSDIYHSIGEQTAEIRSLRRDLEASERRASDSRGKMHARLDGLAERTTTLEGRMEHVEQLHGDTASFVRQQRELESGRRVAWRIVQTIGTPAWTAVKWIGGMALLALLAFWRELKEVLAAGGGPGS